MTIGELKKALEMNFGQGFDAITAREIALRVARTLEAHGQDVTPDIIEMTIKNVLSMQLPAGEKARYEEILGMIDELPKFGNDIDEVDELARDAAYTYTRPLESFQNPRGGIFQAGPLGRDYPAASKGQAVPSDFQPLRWDYRPG